MSSSNAAVLVLGSEGRVGRVLRERCSDLGVLFTDVADLDAREEQALAAAGRSCPRWVHLASALHQRIDPRRLDGVATAARERHVALARSVIAAAVRCRVDQLILLSSIHAADVHEDAPERDSPGLSHAGMNLAIEAAGRRASGSGLDVVCLRLGGLRWPDAPGQTEFDRRRWVSHADCAAAFRAVLEADVRPGHYECMTVVSRLAGGFYDAPNRFGWRAATTEVGWRRALHAQVVAIKCRVLDRPRVAAARAAARRLLGQNR
jgi:nucleoside-diphosphate-sugar epimerase